MPDNKLALSQDSLRSLLERYQPHMRRMLPRHIKAERMYQVALLGIQRTPRLLECTQASLIGCILQCAQLGLEPDGLSGRAYLVPYKNNKIGRYVCELIVGYRGMMDLARRSGHVSRFQAFAVYEDDEFDYEYGFEQRLHYKPTAKVRTNDKLVAAFAMAFEDGFGKFHVSNLDEILFARSRSKSPNDGPWKTDFASMAAKTAVRRFCKFIPTSYELAAAVTLDEAAESAESQHVEMLVPELIEPGDVETPDTDPGAEEQALTKQPATSTPSAVLAAGRLKGWTNTQTAEFVGRLVHKELTDLSRNEVDAMVKAIADARDAPTPA